MELLAYLAALYVWQCVVYVPTGAWAFVPLLRDVRMVGDGLRVLNPWPSARSLVAMRLPFRMTLRGLTCPRPVSRFGAIQGIGKPQRASFEALSRAEVSDALITVEGRPWLRAPSAAHARALHAVLTQIGRSTPEQRGSVLELAIRRSLSLSALKGQFDVATRDTVVLGWCCNAYLLTVFLLPLGLLMLLPVPNALALVIPPFIVLHFGTLVQLYLTQRRVRPELERRWETLLVCALYPPALLRSRQLLMWERVGACHPAAVAALLLRRNEFIDFVRQQLARLRYDVSSSTSDEIDDGPEEQTDARVVEIESLEALAVEAGVAKSELDAPRSRRDPQAASYCALCLAEYLARVTRCATCAVETVPYVNVPTPTAS